MPDTIIFDSLGFVKRGVEAGASPELAEWLAREQVQLLEHNLATKKDIEDLRAATQTDLAGIQKDIAGLQKETAELKKETAELKKETVSLQKDIVAVKQDLSDKAMLIIRWNLGTMLAVAGLLLAALKFL